MRAKNLYKSWRNHRDEARMRPSENAIVSVDGTMVKVLDSGISLIVCCIKSTISTVKESPKLAESNVNRTETYCDPGASAADLIMGKIPNHLEIRRYCIVDEPAIPILYQQQRWET